jgi:hypothetical protein
MDQFTPTPDSFDMRENSPGEFSFIQPGTRVLSNRLLVHLQVLDFLRKSLRLIHRFIQCYWSAFTLHIVGRSVRLNGVSQVSRVNSTIGMAGAAGEDESTTKVQRVGEGGDVMQWKWSADLVTAAGRSSLLWPATRRDRCGGCVAARRSRLKTASGALTQG